MSDYHYEVVFWGPEDAEDRLRSLVPGQRLPDFDKVRIFKEKMSNGTWHPGIGAPVAFNSRGLLQNGMHRLKALSQMPEGTKIPLLVFWNMPDWAVNHYDSGRIRTNGHHLKLAFPDRPESHCRAAASIAILLMGCQGAGMPRVNHRFRPEEIVAYVQHREDQVFTATQTAISLASKTEAAGKVGTVRTYGYVVFHLPESVPFFEGLATRNGLFKGDPRDQMVKHYVKQSNAFPTDAESRETTLRRIADLFGCWHASEEKAPWMPWRYGDNDTFRHPLRECRAAA